MGNPKLEILERIPLSPIEHVHVGERALPSTLLFQFATPPDARRLEDALAEVLDVFVTARGFLVRTDASSYAIELGPWDLASHWSVEHVDRLPSAEDFAALAASVEPVKTLEGEPLFRARLIVAPDGAWLASSLSRAVGDEYAHFLFLDAWARAARGEHFAAPSFDRETLIPAVSPQAPKVTEESFYRRTGYRWASTRAEKVVSRVRSWTAAETAEFFDRYADGAGLSLNDCLVASLWKEIGAEWAQGEPLRRLVFAYDYRRLVPGLGPLFFGNAIGTVHVSLDIDRWQEAGVSDLAQRARASVARVDLSSVRDHLSCLEELRQQRGAGVIEEIDRSPARFAFFVGNFSRFPLRQLDFGSGSPQRMRVPSAPPRTVLILPVAGGGLDLQIQAPEPKP